MTENRGDGEEALGGEKQELLGHVRSATLLGCPGKTQRGEQCGHFIWGQDKFSRHDGKAPG